MRGVLGALQDRVAANTSALPSKEEAVAQADAARPIPPHDPAATDPAGAYPLAGIVPPPEWAALPAAALVAAGDAKARAALLPHTRSDYVWAHLRTVFAAPKPKTEDVRTLVYISYLLAFRGLARTLDSADAVRARLRGVPAPVLDGLLARFAEAARGSTACAPLRLCAVRPQTGATETKLLTHLFALCLRLDDYAVDTAVLAKDLSMTAPACGHFPSVFFPY
jgi:DNA-directed RNA polymerase I subunit RPA49